MQTWMQTILCRHGGAYSGEIEMGWRLAARILLRTHGNGAVRRAWADMHAGREVWIGGPWKGLAIASMRPGTPWA